MEPQTFFLVIVKCLVLVALVLTLVRTLGTTPKHQPRHWWQQKPLKAAALLSTPRLEVQFCSSQQLSFEWQDVAGATHYQLLERPGPNSVFQPVGASVPAGREKRLVSRPLHSRLNTQYVLRACNDSGFVDSAALCVGERLMVKLNYLQKHDINPTEYFGFSVTQSAGGRTLIIAETDQANLTSDSSHSAAYVFLRDMKGQWNKLAYMQGDKAREISELEQSIEAPQISPAETAIAAPRRHAARAFRFNPNWQDAARNLRWLNFNSP